MSHGLTWIRASLVAGLAVFGFLRSAQSGEPLDDRLGVRSAPILLLTRSDIQKDLGLNEAQIAEVHKEAAVLVRKARALKGSKASGVVAARRVIDEESTHFLDMNLTPKQRERLAQVELQWEGPAALLSRPLLVDYLTLTPEQQDKVARCISEARKTRPPGPWDYDSHVALTRKAISLLTEKQQELWVGLLASPCRFSITARPAQPAKPQPRQDAQALRGH